MNDRRWRKGRSYDEMVMTLTKENGQKISRFLFIPGLGRKKLNEMRRRGGGKQSTGYKHSVIPNDLVQFFTPKSHHLSSI
uniref:Transposase n=1 Tax=Caenorhabditis tropicalis TaxID=1561998 RepID=A0A1I7U7W5_9PELO